MSDDASVVVEAVVAGPTAEHVHVVRVVVPVLVDGPGLDELRREVDALCSGHPRIDLLIDLAGVRMLSSAAIGAIGSMHRQIWGGKGRMKLCSISPEVMQVFRLIRLDGVFDIHPSRDAALGSF